MNKKVIYISDFFLNEITGGAELNDHELINILIDNGYSVQKIKCSDVTKNFLINNKNSFYN